MTPRSSSRQPIGMSPSGILKLGQTLAHHPALEKQKAQMLDFLQTNFQSEAYLEINKAFLPLDDFRSPLNIPLNPSMLIEGETFAENDHSYWLAGAMSHGEIDIGNLIIHRETPFTAAEKNKLTQIGAIAGTSLYATLQTIQREWQQKQLELVQSVSAQISQINDLDSLTEAITRLVQETFEWYYVAVFLIDDESQRLKFKASACSDESDRPDFETPAHPGFALGEHMIGYVAETGQELVASDVTREPRYKEVDSLDDTKSELVLPLSVTGKIFGVFDIQSDRFYGFNDNDLIVLRVLAANISIAIESTRLFQDLQWRADQMTTVAEASRALTQILDTDQLLQRIVDLIHERFGFQFVHLYLVDPVQSKIIFKAGSGERSERFNKAQVGYDLNAKKGVIPWVVRHKESKRINDVEKEPLYRNNPLTEDQSGSELSIPLQFGGDVLGVLDIQCEDRNAFTSDDQQLVETFADNIAVSIRNARLYRSEKWRRQVAESLRDVAGLLSNNADLNEVLQAILEQLHKNLPCDVAGIWLFDSNSTVNTPIEERRLYLAASLAAEGLESEDLGDLNFLPNAWVKKALMQEQPTIRHSDQSIGPIAAHYGFTEEYSSIAAPLHTGDEILGMLTLINRKPGRYGQESQKITSAFASYGAIAIENTRLYESSQEQAWVSTILLQVAQAVQSMTNLDELTQTIVRLTPMVAGIKGCALFLRNTTNDIYALQAMYGIGDSGEITDNLFPLPLPNAPLLAELTLTREPLLVIDPTEDLNLPEQLENEINKDTLILLPIISHDDVLGAFMLANDPVLPIVSSDKQLISEERLKIIMGIIQQTAVAVENIQLLEARQEEAYISTVLLQAAQVVVSSADLVDTLDSIVHLMPILAGIESSAIYMWDADKKVFILTESTEKAPEGAEPLNGTSYEPGDFPMLDVVFENDRPIVFPFVENVLPLEDWDLALPDEGQTDPTPILVSPFPLLMGFPISAKDNRFGVLLALDKNLSTNRERRFELINGIAQQVSLAVQNDILNKEMLDRQRLEREFQLAREIQQTFLPSQIPPMPGWEMDVRWNTAHQVGGDFYDYFLLPDGRLAVIIADVSNKGLAASLYMTVTRTLIKAAALEYTSPARTLERVNELLLMNSQNGLFVTTFYGLLDLTDGVLTYTIAGHNPPLVLHKLANQVEELNKGGIALGALPDIHLEDRSLTLDKGDCLMLYTDGVTEAFNNDDEMYGTDRLFKLLQSACGASAHQLLTLLDEDLQEFRKSAPLSDDTTILAVCREDSLTNQDRDGSLPQNTVNSATE
ncbi:GAF domain-containing protein [Chloroflexota bacterium]|nr:GAF domain-containing protein [Chloroflexota bacterium]